jgi:hypothetical protein
MPTMVVMKFTEVKMVPRPDRTSPMLHRSGPVPGVLVWLLSGVYAVQP